MCGPTEVHLPNRWYLPTEVPSPDKFPLVNFLYHGPHMGELGQMEAKKLNLKAKRGREGETNVLEPWPLGLA